MLEEHQVVAVKDRQMLGIFAISMPPEFMLKSKQDVLLAVMRVFWKHSSFLSHRGDRVLPKVSLKEPVFV